MRYALEGTTTVGGNNRLLQIAPPADAGKSVSLDLLLDQFRDCRVSIQEGPTRAPCWDGLYVLVPFYSCHRIPLRPSILQSCLCRKFSMLRDRPTLGSRLAAS